MKKIEALRSIKTLDGLAKLLGFKVGAVNFILYKLSDQIKYRTFEIPKRIGGVRKISAPDPRLKLLQKKLSVYLGECLAEIEDGFPSPAHGFKTSRSIFTNAAQHLRRRHVLNLDLEDFFPSIHFGRIAGYFEKSKHFGLSPIVSRILANLVCHETKLPQGAPSSPIVSNLLARMLDANLAKFAKKNRLSYTRYADDLTFSTNLRKFPKNAAKKISEHDWEIGDELMKIIRSCGFRINSKKTRMQYRSSRQEVTGLVVNDKVSVPVEYRRWVRAAVSNLVSKGVYFESLPKGFVGPSGTKQRPGTLDHLEGCLSHIFNAHLFQREKVALGVSKKSSDFELNSDERVYRKFLFYAKFYAHQKPVVVCEGETDSIYVAQAISMLGKSYPELIKSGAGKGEVDRFKVRFVKHGAVANRLLCLNGGTDQLKNFCRIYVDHVRSFNLDALSKPVIVLVDNDKAGRDVVSYVRGISKNQGVVAIPGVDYVFAKPNLYVVRIKNAQDNEDFVIENLFSNSLLEKKLGGKNLTLSNKRVGQGEYGKMMFAKYVVPEAEEKDFYGFKPLLDSFVQVLADFESRIYLHEH